MSYSVTLYLKAAKKLYPDGKFPSEHLVLPTFTSEQFDALHRRLVNYEFILDEGDSEHNLYHWKQNDAVTAILLPDQLIFSTESVTETLVFEILQTGSEFTDSGEYVLFNPQEGGWINLGEG